MIIKIKFEGKSYVREDLSALTGYQLLDLFNRIQPQIEGKTTERFSTREAGERRTWGALVAYRALGESEAAPATPKAATPKAATPKAATPKAATPKAATPKAATPKAAVNGSIKGYYANKKLRVTALANPRRPNTKAAKSWDLVAKNPGIEYKTFIQKGGRAVDLSWDIRHGTIIAE